ncbi:hypothetical protein [Agrococcus sp. DT81.2]|uniref:hypothetical protein n=1 Tax=Agrococcus sp. DT81.2 TaxID=3393414 RepID=UPI003CE44C54
MTTIDERSGPARAHDVSNPSALLPLWPWNALRPASGMLLDSDDFEVMLGNPRAKHMLHNAWLHGRGVVWGLPVSVSGEWDLRVSPGLAVDGVGRELHLEAQRCISFRDILEADHDATCATREVELCLVLSFDACLDRPVPALADPCDVTRESQEYSRVDERARLSLVRGHPRLPHTFRRVRVLLGLDRVVSDDEAAREALSARNEVLAVPAHARAAVLLRWYRCLAARDAADLAPSGDDCDAELFPVTDADAGVVLACIRMTVKDQAGCPEIVGDPEIDDCCRPTIIPTTVIQDLVCGLAPATIGAGDTTIGEGPQAVPGSIEWSAEGTRLSFRVTADLLPATLSRDAVKVSSLSDSGWIVEDLERRPRYDEQHQRVIVHLAERVANPLIRVVIAGTGATPVYGADPRVPLAGVVGDDPGTTGQGRDAVLTAGNPRFEPSASDGAPPAAEHHDEASAVIPEGTPAHDEGTASAGQQGAEYRDDDEQ